MYIIRNKYKSDFSPIVGCSWEQFERRADDVKTEGQIGLKQYWTAANDLSTAVE